MPKNIVLDLDQTLIYCPEKLNDIPLHCLTNLRAHNVFLNGEFHLIFERPFLGEFLRGLRGKRIAIWTAADKSYAYFIVSQILEPYLGPDQRFEFVWHRKHCGQSRATYKLDKHLNYLHDQRKDFRRADTMIIDDNANYLEQDNNVYIIREFTARDLDDTELLRVLEVLNV